MSGTETTNEHDDDKNALSVAVHVTVVFVAIENWLPDAGLHDVLLIPELSVADLMAYVTVAYDWPRSIDCVMLDGHTIVGWMVSTTFTVDVQDDFKL